MVTYGLLAAGEGRVKNGQDTQVVGLGTEREAGPEESQVWG